jgi:hypothetical protein
MKMISKMTFRNLKRKQVRLLLATLAIVALVIPFQNCGKVSISGSTANTVIASSGVPAVCSVNNLSACSAGWGLGNWGSCTTTCGQGTKRQEPVCKNKDGSLAPASQCVEAQPAANVTSCVDYSGCTYGWTPGSWSGCSATCGNGIETQSRTCTRSDGTIETDLSKCPNSNPETRTCTNISGCTYSWSQGAWGACSTTCGTGTQTQSRTCMRSDGSVETDVNKCPNSKENTQACNDNSGCAALNCNAGFSPNSVSVKSITAQANSLLIISAPTGTSGSYSCSPSPAVNGVAPVTGTFTGSTASLSLSFSYPTLCTVTVNRTGSAPATCSAKLEVTCGADQSQIQNLYNATIVEKTATQQLIANHCEDAGYSAALCLSIKANEVQRFQKWQINCATRFCVVETKDPLAMGFIDNSEMKFDGNGPLIPTAISKVRCQYNSTQSVPISTNVCQVEVNRNPAIVTYPFNSTSDLSTNACGTSIPKALDSAKNLPTAPNGAIGCGTTYCKGLNLDYKAGALTDILYDPNNLPISGFTIRCTKASGLY